MSVRTKKMTEEEKMSENLNQEEPKTEQPKKEHVVTNKSVARPNTDDFDWNALDQEKSEYTEEQQKEYNDIVIPYEKSKEALLPSFVESNWIKTTDATAKLDLTKVPENKLGFQPYVLWMKVEASDNTYYGDQVVTAKKQAIDPEANEESPGTGDEIMLIALGAIAVAGIMVVSYKKANA